MADNFKAWSVVDKDGNFIVAIMVAPDFSGLPDIPEQFRRMAKGVVKLVDGLPPGSWFQWVANHWQARAGQEPEAHDDSDGV
jgi:hypothetical protein